MSEQVFGSAPLFATASVWRIFRRLLPIYAVTIAVELVFQILHISYLNEYVALLGISIPAIFGAYSAIMAQTPDLRSGAMAALCFVVAQVPINLGDLALTSLKHGTPHVKLLILPLAIVSLWISVKLAGAPFFVLFRNATPIGAIRLSWARFSGRHWWELFGNALLAGIPYGIFRLIILGLPIDPLVRMAILETAGAITTTYVTLVTGYLTYRGPYSE